MEWNGTTIELPKRYVFTNLINADWESFRLSNFTPNYLSWLLFSCGFFPDVGHQSLVTSDTYYTEFNEIFKWAPFILVPKFFEGIEKKSVCFLVKLDLSSIHNAFEPVPCDSNACVIVSAQVFFRNLSFLWKLRITINLTINIQESVNRLL